MSTPVQSELASPVQMEEIDMEMDEPVTYEEESQFELKELSLDTLMPVEVSGAFLIEPSPPRLWCE